MEKLSIPKIGLGTYGLREDEGTHAVLSAIELGYRHLDTAQTYENEAAVGNAIEQTSTAREDLFVTTKITPENFGRLAESLRESCDKLRVDQVDLTLIHWPSPNEEVPVAAYINQLAQAQADGLTRLIGVSNFTRKHLAEVDKELGNGRLATNQVECHAYLQNRVLTDYCDAAGLQVTAYMPMAKGRLRDDPVLVEIAKNHNANSVQVALAFLLHKGFVIIPKSSQPERMKSNLGSGDITLSDDEIGRIETLDQGKRYVDPDWGPDWD